MGFIEGFFRRCVEAGQKDGTIASTRAADEFAKLLLSVLIGVRVLARTRPQREVLEGAANSVIALLAVPTAARPSARASIRRRTTRN